MKYPRPGVSLVAATGLALGLLSGPARAQDASNGAGPSNDKAPSFLRVIEEPGRMVELQVSSHTLARRDESGPSICLVGVAHIGEKSQYEAIEKLLAQYDVVLYESVKPPGANPAGGDTPRERIDSTEASMGLVAGLIETYRDRNGTVPADADRLMAFATTLDPRIGRWAEQATTDAWGNHLSITLDADDDSYRLTSRGADGAPGGEGESADLNITETDQVMPLELASEGGLQAELASALGLEFQLEAIDYSGDNWRCSDMSMDQMDRALQDHGLELDPLQGALAGSSFPAKIAKVLLWFLRIADSLTDGAVTDVVKVALIEILGDESLIELSLEQVGPGLKEVLVDQRNQVVIDDLKQIIENETEVESIAILYGAAHMPDLIDRLSDQIGYEPVSEQWVTAIRVDYEQSALTPAEMRQFRLMLQQTLKRQLRMMGR